MHTMLRKQIQKSVLEDSMLPQQRLRTLVETRILHVAK